MVRDMMEIGDPVRPEAGAMWDQSVDLLAVASSSGYLTAVNPSWSRVLGWTPEQLTSRPYREFVHPDDVDAMLRSAKRHREAGLASHGFECRYRCADGTYRMLEWSSRVNATGDEVYCVARDVTERIQVQDAQITSEHRFHSMFIDHDAVMLLIDPATGMIVDANPSAVAFYGYPLNELRAMPITDINVLPGEEVARAYSAARAGDCGHYVFPHRLASGDIRMVEVHSTPIHDGRELLFSILHDVTSRVRAEADLADSERRYRLLAENSEGAVLLVSQDDRITWVSPSIERLLGYSDDEVLERDPARFVHPQDVNAAKSFAGMLAASGAASEELRIRGKDGEYRWIAVTSRTVADSDGAGTCRVDVLRDVDEEVRARQLLAQQTQRVELVLACSRLGLWDWDIQTRGLVLNDRWAEIVGYRLDELRPLSIDTWLGLVHPEDLAKSDALIKDHVQGRIPFYDCDARMRHRDGHWVWVRDRGRVVEWTPDGLPLRMTGTHEDITAQKAADDELHRSRMVLEQAQRIAHVGSWTLELATDRVVWSEELYLMLGLDPSEPPPDHTKHGRLFTAESWERLTVALAVTRDGGAPYELELEIVRADGTHGWMLARGEALRDANDLVVALVGVGVDITARKLAGDELLKLATHDPLTGLANRAALLDEITRALSAGRRSGRLTAVLMVDLDRFKVVNDSLGHAAGDDLLTSAAQRINAVVRAGDLAARPGGDEFVVVMRDLDDASEAVRAAGRLVQAFRGPFLGRDGELFATASVGVAVSSSGSDADDLMREADTAMYVAKGEGRDRVSVYNEDLRAAVTARFVMEGELRHALERHQLAVWFQPEVDLATGSVIAAEALLRWRHPSGEVLTADRFIEVAEDAGLILDIGDWVLHTACAQGASWAAVHREQAITVRINVSALQLAEAGLLDAVDDALGSSGLDPALLCLEITETALMRETDIVRANLVGMRERGIAIAVDDFGTGYASLAYLRRFAVDVLKIDRSFIAGITTDDRDRRIVAGILALAHQLGMSVTAEGVETQEQAELLSSLGCRGAQGFLFSPAVPPEELGPLLFTG